MTKIVVQPEIADQIRHSNGPIELIDDQGVSIGIVHRPPTEEEIAAALERVGKPGPKFTIEQLIVKVEALRNS